MKPCLMGLKELALKRTTSCDCQMDTCSHGVEGGYCSQKFGQALFGNQSSGICDEKVAVGK